MYLLLATPRGLNFWLAMVISMTALALIGIVMSAWFTASYAGIPPELLYRRHRDDLISSWTGRYYLFGPDFKRFPPVHTQVVQVLERPLPYSEIIIILVTVTLIVLCISSSKSTLWGRTIEQQPGYGRRPSHGH